MDVQVLQNVEAAVAREMIVGMPVLQGTGAGTVCSMGVSWKALWQQWHKRSFVGCSHCKVRTPESVASAKAGQLLQGEEARVCSKCKGRTALEKQWRDSF